MRPFTPDLDDVQSDVLVGVPKLAQTFCFLEIVNVAAFKSAFRRSIAHRATPARVGRGLGLNVAFTATGCVKLIGDRLPPDPAFQAGASHRASYLGDAEPATNWLPQFYGIPIDVVVVVYGGSENAVEAEWKLLQHLLGSSVRVSFREMGRARAGSTGSSDHFGNEAGSGEREVEPSGTIFRNEWAGIDPAPLAWMKNGSYMVFRRIEQLVPEYENFARSRPAARGMDAVWRASRLVRRGIAFGPEVTELERWEGKSNFERGLLFVSYQTSLAQFECVQRSCFSPKRFAINSAAAYAFMPSISALANEFGR
jgi:hypothetical protein